MGLDCFVLQLEAQEMIIFKSGGALINLWLCDFWKHCSGRWETGCDISLNRGRSVNPMCIY